MSSPSERTPDRLERESIAAVVSAFESLLAGGHPKPLDPDAAPASTLPLVQSADRLMRTVEELRLFMHALSTGDLSASPPARANLLASPLKELQSRLTELIWKGTQVAHGDFSQRVDFMGNLADTFNATVAALERREREFQLMSFLDELTGLYNRRGFMVLGEQATRGAIRNGGPLTCIYGDMDGLKKINDTHGHAVGDRALRDIAVLLRNTLREADIVARVGGDEFAVLVQATAQAGNAMIERLDEAVASFNRGSSEPYKLIFSTGITTAPPGPELSLESLLRGADRQMYEAKRRRRDGEASPG